MEITCEQCLEDYDASHLEDEPDWMVKEIAETDGWQFGFFTTCPKCIAKHLKETEEDIDNETDCSINKNIGDCTDENQIQDEIQPRGYTPITTTICPICGDEHECEDM